MFEDWSQNDLLSASPLYCNHFNFSEFQVLQMLQACEAVWLHDGDPAKPHAMLSSGLCSNGYFNWRQRVARYPRVCEILAFQLYIKIKSVFKGYINWVIGPAYGAITLADRLAHHFQAQSGCVESHKYYDIGLRKKKFHWNNDPILKGEKVLLAEDVITTGLTTSKVINALEKNGNLVDFLPVIACAVLRPEKLPLPQIQGRKFKIISLIKREVASWKQEECPLCNAGSKRISPKEHWTELTGKS